jgi:predicted PhzF superfamily epimerase YddE/YHI9
MKDMSLTIKGLSVVLCSQITGTIVTLKSSGAPYDFVSRYFAPWNGIPEDPVTGGRAAVSIAI